MGNKKKLLLTIVISGIAFIIGYLVNFFLTRFVTDNIGTDAYGYVNLCKTIASYAVIATTALNSYASRYIAIEYHRGNYDKANIYFNSVLWCNVYFGLVLLVGSAITSVWIGSILNVSDVLLGDVKVLLILVFLNLCITLAGTAFQATAYIKDKLLLVSLIKGASYFAEAICLLLLYSTLTPKVSYVGIGLIVATLLNVFGYIYITRRFTIELKINIKDFEWKSVKELIINGIWNSFNSLGNTLNSGLDLIVSNSLLSAFAMGQVSIVKSIVTIFSSLYQMVAQPFQPSFLQLYAKGDYNSLKKELFFSSKLSGLISNLAFAGVVGFGFSYFKLWIPNQDCDLLYKLSVIAVASSIFEGAIYPLYYIYTLTVKNKYPCIVTIFGGIVNVLGMYLLIKDTSMGIYAIFATTAFIMLSINGISNPIYMAKCLNLRWQTFYPLLLRHVMSCIIMTAVMYGISKIMFIDSWFKLIMMGTLGCIVCSVLHFIIMFNREEHKRIIEKFSGLIFKN